MSKYRKGMLYVRRISPSDKTDSYVTAIQMAAKLMLSRKYNRRPPFVLVRYGHWGMEVIEVGDSRAELLELLSRINFGVEPFKAISRRWRDGRSAATEAVVSGEH